MFEIIIEEPPHSTSKEKLNSSGVVFSSKSIVKVYVYKDRKNSVE